MEYVFNLLGIEHRSVGYWYFFHLLQKGLSVGKIKKIIFCNYNETI
jgi:hypothetical protein